MIATALDRRFELAIDFIYTASWLFHARIETPHIDIQAYFMLDAPDRYADSTFFHATSISKDEESTVMRKVIFGI